MSHAAAPPPVRIAEFDGVIASLGGTPHDELIVGTIGALLRRPMRARGCCVSQGGVHLQSRGDGEGDTKPRPDLIAFCGPLDLRCHFVTRPLAVVDGLSPSNLETA